MDQPFEKSVKLHLGCGKRDFGPEWIHIDGGNFPHVHFHDITKLPFPDNSAEIIYASHVIEYFDREEVVSVLREWRRVLKPKGVLRIAVPDFRAMANLYSAGTFPLESFLGTLYGKMVMGEHILYHKTTYDFESLRALVTSVGFTDVQKYDWQTTEPHSHFDDRSQAYLPKMDKEHGTLISLNVEARKDPVEHIYSNVEPGVLLHIVDRAAHITNSRRDVAPSEEYLQMASIRGDTGMTFKPHKHIIKETVTNITQESWIVIRGKVKATLYDLDDTIISEPILEPGDCSMTFRGGHTYTLLEPNTLVREYKTGPYFGQEKDKVFI